MSGIPEISEAHIVAQIRSLRVDPFNIFEQIFFAKKLLRRR